MSLLIRDTEKPDYRKYSRMLLEFHQTLWGLGIATYIHIQVSSYISWRYGQCGLAVSDIFLHLSKAHIS